MRGYYFAVELGPDKRPSNGREIARGTMEDIEHLWKPGEVVICWSYDAPPPRRLSQSSLASVRKKRLTRRLTRKFPLIAPQLIEDELKARPEFYNGCRS